MEGVLTIKKEGTLKAIIYNDQKRRAQITYIVKEAGLEDIQDLLGSRDNGPQL